jgi:hypothetical protein
MRPCTVNRLHRDHPVQWADEITHINALLDEHTRRRTPPPATAATLVYVLVAVGGVVATVLLLLLAWLFAARARGEYVDIPQDVCRAWPNTTAAQAFIITAVPQPQRTAPYSVTAKLQSWASLNGAGVLWKLGSYVPWSTYRDLVLVHGGGVVSAVNMWRIMAGLMAVATCAHYVLTTGGR